jgi:NSS family neurotransmitter:Na+ symporter
VQQARDHWSSRVGFVLAAAGSAVGLGNLWKFPYITWDNRGGAFVLVYLVCIALIGLPIMMTEILVGRKTQKSPVGALKAAVGPAWGLVGGLGIFTGFVILGYYTVIAGWSLRNFVNCLNWSLTEFPSHEQVTASFGAFLQDWKLQLSTSALFMAATMGVIFGGIGKGIERAARCLMPVLFLILVLLLGSALSMSGAGEALSFIFVPDFDNLGWHGVLEALGHSFFTLSLGMGAMITYGSYMRREESVVRASLLVVILDTLIALAATVIMFSVIFSVAGMKAQVGEVGTFTMLFVTLPEMFYSSVPLGGVLAPLFYVLVAFAALTSTISLLEVVVSYFIDERGMTRTGATVLCGSSTLVLTLLCSVSLGAWGLVSDFPGFPGANDARKAGLLANLDHLASNWLLPIGGFFITLAVGWFMTRRDTEVELVDSRTPAWFRYGAWRFIIRYVAPLAVFTIICFVIFAGEDFS